MSKVNSYFEPVQLELPLGDVSDSSYKYTQSYNNEMDLVSWDEYETISYDVSFSEDALRDFTEVGKLIQPKIIAHGESDILRRELQQLTETLYSQYKRIASLVTEVTRLTKELNNK